MGDTVTPHSRPLTGLKSGHLDLQYYRISSQHFTILAAAPINTEMEDHQIFAAPFIKLGDVPITIGSNLRKHPISLGSSDFYPTGWEKSGQTPL
jgi:hypothetical protein